VGGGIFSYSFIYKFVEMKKALITGITGQDGSYLAELLYSKGYEVYGFMRRTSTDPFARIEELYVRGHIKLVYGNMRDLPTITAALEKVKPDEIYNLAAQSHVGVSFTCPDETFDVNYSGVGRLVKEAFRVNPKVKIYQASTSEMYGNSPHPQSETTPFAPVSPYAEAKLKAHEEFVCGYRDKGFFICSGILFNHESPRRGKHFVTRKLTHSLAKVKLGLQEHVTLGNLEARRDWGFAGDYVEAMWLMLQQDKPEDFVIASGQSYSVRDFVQVVGLALGMKITWEGKGIDEVGKDQNGKIVVRVSDKFYRPNEVNYLLGDSTKAQQKLGWKLKTDFKTLVEMMVDSDLKLVARTYDNSERIVTQ
jgi:GDPmannose 4,6-dehydratase